jgi:hypothetical protein
MKLACNYAIVRFLPYPETGEFVNVGVVLVCAATGFFDFQMAQRRRRVTDFFRELDPRIYQAGSRFFREELGYYKNIFPTGNAFQYALPETQQLVLETFRKLVRPRESLFRFGEIQTALAKNPQIKLQELFEHFVNRQFAREKEYQEMLMANHLREVFHRLGVARQFRQEALGNERYEVTLPFVYRREERLLKAIKPLDLDKPTSTKIYEHGDQWVNRLNRLTEMGKLPEQMLFAVREPEPEGTRAEAAKDILSRLRSLHARVVPMRDEKAVVDFTRVA